jgi:hypothetical protein
MKLTIWACLTLSFGPKQGKARPRAAQPDGS